MEKDGCEDGCECCECCECCEYCECCDCCDAICGGCMLPRPFDDVGGLELVDGWADGAGAAGAGGCGGGAAPPERDARWGWRADADAVTIVEAIQSFTETTKKNKFNLVCDRGGVGEGEVQYFGEGKRGGWGNDV